MAIRRYYQLKSDGTDQIFECVAKVENDVIKNIIYSSNVKKSGRLFLLKSNYINIAFVFA